jgi:hypothetical protein
MDEYDGIVVDGWWIGSIFVVGCRHETGPDEIILDMGNRQIDTQLYTEVGVVVIDRSTAFVDARAHHFH